LVAEAAATSNRPGEKIPHSASHVRPWVVDQASEFGARRTILYLVALFLLAAASRALLARCIEAPRIFDDELRYVELARSVPRGRGLLWGDLPAGFPCYLYPLLLAPLVTWLPMETAYEAIRVLNALLMAAAVFPAYGLAREVTGRGRAFAAALLVALIPGAGYSAMVLTESLFYPVFTLALWLVFRAILDPTPLRRVSAGLACALAFHVKPQGLLLPLIVVLGVFLFEWSRIRKTPDPAGLLRRAGILLRSVARHWLTAAGWVVGMVPRVLEVARLEEGHQAVTLQAVLGLYFGTMVGQTKRTFRWDGLGLSLAGYLALWVAVVGFFPAWTLARETVRAARGRSGPPVRLLTILTGVSTALALFLAARHVLVSEDLWRAYERYFIFVLPGSLILFCARDEPTSTRSSFLIRVGVALPTLLLGFSAARELQWYLTSDSPTLSGFFLSYIEGRAPASVAFLLLLSAALALFVGAQKTFRARWVAVSALFLAYNFGWYATHATVFRRAVRADVETARSIAQRVSPGRDLIILLEDLNPNIYWRVDFWRASRATYVRKQPYWFALPLDVGSDGSIRPGTAPERSDLLAGDRWKFNRSPVAVFPGASLYSLGGVPLRLEQTESGH
jgi:4-amino-4-deoxy-L-arabinose transferase-like glycosyltransferase